MNKEKILLIDGHALFHRAYHALPGLTNKEGFPTGAIYGFLNIMFKALEQLKPTHILVAFDLPGETYRHKLAIDYKAHRKPMEDDLAIQLPKLKEVLEALNIPMYVKPGFEADDVIGIITRKTSKDMQNIILTGDMDFLQLINENTVVMRLKTGISEVILFDEEKMEKDYGLTPKQWIDYKALRGDPSDNIPGVPGVGEKTGMDLIREYGNIEELFEAIEKNPEKFKPGVLKKLIDGKDKAFLSYKLAEIDCTNGLDFDLEKTKIASFGQEKAVKILEELGMKSLISKLTKNEENLA